MMLPIPFPQIVGGRFLLVYPKCASPFAIPG
jgi:hypothetical protein